MLQSENILEGQHFLQPHVIFFYTFSCGALGHSLSGAGFQIHLGIWNIKCNWTLNF